MSLNRTQMIGNLGSDPELGYTRYETPSTTLRVAVDRSVARPDGSYEKVAEWFRVIAFGRLAENCTRYLQRGSLVYVEGRLTNRRWRDEQGNEHLTTEIIADMIEFLSRGGTGQGQADPDQGQGESQYGRTTGRSAGPVPSSSPIPIAPRLEAREAVARWFSESSSSQSQSGNTVTVEQP